MIFWEPWVFIALVVLFPLYSPRRRPLQSPWRRRRRRPQQRLQHRDVVRVWGWCGSGVGVVRQEYGRGVGGSNLRLGGPEPAFGVRHSSTF